jgi:hypothetical protein
MGRSRRHHAMFNTFNKLIAILHSQQPPGNDRFVADSSIAHSLVTEFVSQHAKVLEMFQDVSSRHEKA